MRRPSKTGNAVFFLSLSLETLFYCFVLLESAFPLKDVPVYICLFLYFET